MNITPAMQQYYDMKKEYPDAILFFRMGDFYEMFEQDAQIAHKVLGISLTSRNKNSENPIALAGIPYHAKEKYLPALLAAGYKVAIAEQVSDPSAKGIVQREVQRVVTPATAALEGEAYSMQDMNSVMISISKKGDTYGFSSIDLTSQTWICSEFSDFTLLSNELYKIFPSEIILEKQLTSEKEFTDILSKKYATNIFYSHMGGDSKIYLQKALGVKNLISFGIEKKLTAQSAAALLHDYLLKNQKTHFESLRALSYKSFGERMTLDEATIKSLDLVYNIATNSYTQGTLFGVLSHSKTSMGKRYLREQILHPLKDIKEIKNRQEFIAAFKSDSILLDKVRHNLKYIGDIDMFLTRLSVGRVGPKDIVQFKKSLIAVREVFTLLESSNNQAIQKLIKHS